MLNFTPLIAGILIATCVTLAPTSVNLNDEAAVERAAMDYVEGLYQVKPELIERSVDPSLTKLGTMRRDNDTAYRTAGAMTYDQLVELAAHWNKGDRARKNLKYKVELLDVMDVTACVKLTAQWGIDYMHLLKKKGQWKIVHILWQSHPPKK